MRIGTLTCSQAAALEELQLNGDLDSAGRFIFAEAILFIGRRIHCPASVAL